MFYYSLQIVLHIVLLYKSIIWKLIILWASLLLLAKSRWKEVWGAMGEDEPEYNIGGA
jgi:hypothetical protein